MRDQGNRDGLKAGYLKHLKLLTGAGVTPMVIFDELALPAKETCVSEKVQYVVAPYEADAQIAYLMKSGVADPALIEDADLLAYGCSKESILRRIIEDADKEEEERKRKRERKEKEKANLLKALILRRKHINQQELQTKEELRKKLGERESLEKNRLSIDNKIMKIIGNK
ncbi:predicted protein [Nematostella vectensis]|uniref:XPG-I domain-containing protein n=1 Tax=Nematostella vectensis TaxID=45351 RepID=A7SEH4_NEMVE|nr:predicted protein [Nematostella vectensis]|eukprot:XP_001629923.1 predicted protein [Nematostella vectensis]